MLTLSPRPSSGACAYLAVAGGMTVPRRLGGRGTDLAGGWGGWHGRALRAGDLLPHGVAARDLAGRRGVRPPAWRDTLRALPGIGDWTAQYIAMRVLRWPDAFVAGDVALHKALGVQGQKQPAKAATEASWRWQPWRSYAVVRAWATLEGTAPTAEHPQPASQSLSNP